MKSIQFYIILIFSCSVFAACYKDKGNYDYKAINELSIKNFNTETGYTINAGDTLIIEPQIEGEAGEYSYKWMLDGMFSDSVLSTEKNLNTKITLSPGRYTLMYEVKDNSTGIKVWSRAELLVTTKIFEGYLVMSEVNGNTRLDMLSYSNANNNYQMFTDVLAEMGSELPVQGKPVQVFCMESEALNITPETFRIYLLTETGTYKINPETFGYGALDEFKYDMGGAIPSDFNPGYITGCLQYYFMPTMFVTEKNNVYRRTYQGAIFPYLPINIYPGESQPFKAFPQVTAFDDGMMIYNMDKRIFTTTPVEGVNVTDLTEDMGFPEGKDMVYMEDHQATGLGYAIMKDPNAANYHLLSFYPGYSFALSFESINPTDFDQASHYAVHPQLGYIFYSVGGKLYEYDPFLHTTFLMLDKGSEEITHLSFQEFFNPTYKERYTELGNMLSVGTLDPSGNEGSNGTLELYSVPSINAPLQLQNSWTGFGKITSIAYRERQ